MKRLVVIAAVVVGAAIAGPAYAGVQVAITSPADGTHSLSGVVPVAVTASADMGIYAVRLNVDGTPVGDWDTSPTAQYSYSIDWDTSTVAAGTHTLTATAIDWSQPFPAGVTQDSAPITVDVGPAYPTISLTAPQAYTFARGQVQIAETHTSALDPTTVALTVDGAPVSATWDSTTVPDGSHTIAATITDGRGKQATASVPVTVDNTGPGTYVLAPAANSFATGTLAVQAQASDAFGVDQVQFAIDGNPVGAALTSPDPSSPYVYSTTLDLTGLANGPHTLTSIATDNAGNTTTSAPVSFTIGTAPLQIAVTAPPDWGYVTKITSLTAAATGGKEPYTFRMLVDGAPVGQPVTAASPAAIPTDTSTLIDGSHTFAVSVTDSTGAKATSTTLHETVDNTAPTAVMYEPTANAVSDGPTTFQVHASDGFGVASVQFTVDGNPVGTLLTKPDTGQLYLYSTSYDTSQLTAGTHAISAIVTDNAGNTTTATPVSIKAGPITYLPVLNYHEIAPPDGYTIYDETPSEADAQLAYLKANGYQSVTLEQYQTWLSSGTLPTGVTKPVLITVDDGIADEQAWDPLLQKYGFTAVMFVITGFADQTTPEDSDPNNMTWAQIQALAANGRWEIAFHAGQYGHGDSYGEGAKIGNATYTAACPYFYSCLNQTTTTKITIVKGKIVRTTTTTPETPAAFEAAVKAEVSAGMAELKAKVPTASFVAWALPFNDAGQWTNLYNDPSGTVQSWLPGFLTSQIPIIFTQTNPVTYGQASGTVGSLSGFGRRYRFEVHTDTTLAQLATALVDPAFTR